MNHDLLVIEEADKKQENRCIVRLKTSMWNDKTGLHVKKSLAFLRRKCEGFNILEEDTSAIGAALVLNKIVNLDTCKDGIYQVVTCDESRDWEGGYIDDYNYKLIPT